MLTYIFFIIYIIALTYITLYCLMQTHLLFFYRRHHRRHNIKDLKKATIDDNLPFVTIQLPIYNELFVVERLIDNIVKQNYPKDKYEIHVLDDSTDETVEITRKKVAFYQAQGFNIQQIKRKNRKGYKAGALKEGMAIAKGDLIAIFDADFLPKPDFLLTTVAVFQDHPDIGVVQTKWEHINKNYSLLTQLQAMQLDVHFTVEQQGRYAGNCLLQFNGTAGMWRRQTIEDAGGWEADTLTEDLDLSYRAQLKGWKIKYLEGFGSPAELPIEMNGLKSQQFRWTKGGAETARKMLGIIWRSNLSLRQKIHGTVHLSASSVFVFIFLAAITSVPLVFFIDHIPLPINPDLLIFFMLGLIGVLGVYYEANVRSKLDESSWLKLMFKFVVYFPLFLAISMGLSLHNTVAVVQGYIGRKSAFIRTPKFNIRGISDRLSSKKYLAKKIGWTTIFEGLFAIYFLVGFIGGLFKYGNSSFIAFHGMLAFGFGMITYWTISHLKLKR